MRKTVNLDEISSRIYTKVKKLRRYGWLSRDVQDMLKEKYGKDKKLLSQVLYDEQKKRDKHDEKIRKLAKKINKLK